MDTKVYELSLDLFRAQYVDVKRMRYGDKNELQIILKSNGQVTDLSSVTAVSLAVKRPDNIVVVIPGSIEESKLFFMLSGNELAVEGYCEAVVQLYDLNNRISSITFKIEAIEDPTVDGFIPSEDEKTLIQIVLGEGPFIIQQAAQATTEANAAKENALDAANNASVAAENANNAAESANTNSNSALDAANNASVAAENANNAAELANTNSNSALDAANSANEAAQSATDASVQANDAANNVNTLILNSRRIGEFSINETYEIGNEVGYNGSSYVAISETTGNLPTNTLYWQLRAQRGIDGTGSVSSVNNTLPDENGNVTLDIATNWADLTGKPETFPPSTHTHTIPDVEGLQDELDGKASTSTVETLQTEVTTHKQDLASQAAGKGASLIGVQDADGLFTSTTVEGALKEAIEKAESAFQTGNNVKADMVAALLAVDPTLPIDVNSTWEEIEIAIGQVNTGKKFATGTATIDSSATVTISGLDFTPTVVVGRTPGLTNAGIAQLTYTVSQDWYAQYGATQFIVGGYNSPQGSATNYNSGSWVITSGGAKLRSRGESIGTSLDWIAIE